ncbi:hypothetical protein D8B26_002479 [Coccidioides posadasii str. Silveira]|uniref:Restriction of telomere capping protein 4 n=2 Tax=Coccidioides posadasii TaxID=199306 RepID=E9DHC2_COCPS|nr:hypothetical protein CPSG_09221 [Coccidioides posadasii str. Silveira]KMM65918.1 hypothetical protein CPAG_02259 [Coccidioides posadasii RMSCC 3488]QVM07788.1 hypothetical protein D8B26_002479 [Coccidioides posadasii str. Silveira]
MLNVRFAREPFIGTLFQQYARDWNNLCEHLQSHRLLLQQIIQSPSQFFFENSLEHNIQAFQKRRKDSQGKSGVPKLPDYQTHGYRSYSPKAYHVLGAEIACLVADDLGIAAVTKPLIRNCGGVADYIPQVLVPEVLIQFIVEDMAVSSVQARRVLEKSRELGEILNEG